MDKEKKIKLIQLGLFVLTVITTTLAGAEWSLNAFLIAGMTWEEFVYGFKFSIPFLAFLSVHEFGHYFTAKYHKIKVSLPYYIPLWLGFIGGPSIGSMGAMIRIREHIGSRLKYFDVGISGPIAGFVIAVGVLWYGFANLPEMDVIYQIHPEYEAYATIEEAMDATEGVQIQLGGNLIFDFFESFVANPERVPPAGEMIHYPLLLAGYLGLFFTALNLLPMGQLDGGHILFGLVGARYHGIVSRVLFTIFILYTGMGFVNSDALENSSWESLGQFLLSIGIYLYIIYLSAYSVFKDKRTRLLYATIIFSVQYFVSSIFNVEGYSGWLLFSILIGRFMGIDHPPVYDNRDIGLTRKVLGWIGLVIFILCFSPRPLIVTY